MSLPIISAQQRLAERKGVKLLMLGKSGIGKTTRLKDLDPATTLFLDIEAGDLAVADWPGDTIRPASWPESRDFFVFLAGPDKSLPPARRRSTTTSSRSLATRRNSTATRPIWRPLRMLRAK